MDPIPLNTRHEVEEDALVRNAMEGDAAALQFIARREQPMVRRMLLRLLGHRNDIDDLVQVVFLEFCRALPGFRRDSKVSTFLGAITIRVARRAMRPTPWFWRRRELVEEPPAPDASLDAQLLAAEQLRRLGRVLEKISEAKRIAFLLWAVDGHDVSVIAEMMEASIPATRSRIFYAQKELKRLARTDPYLREMVEA